MDCLPITSGVRTTSNGGVGHGFTARVTVRRIAAVTLAPTLGVGSAVRKARACSEPGNCRLLP
jgi:hypothetical protein